MPARERLTTSPESRRGDTPGLLLCFAVRQEARGLGPLPSGCRCILTGMGAANAAGALTRALEQITPPSLVISAGFAGGLNPELETGTVVFETARPALRILLSRLGFQAARFYHGRRVIHRAAEKKQLRQESGADAVDMESGALAEICRERGIPFVVLRAISDAAGEDLPLDFGRLLTRRHRMNYPALALRLLANPKKIFELLAFQRSLGEVTKRLGQAVREFLRAYPPR